VCIVSKLQNFKRIKKIEGGLTKGVGRKKKKIATVL